MSKSQKKNFFLLPFYLNTYPTLLTLFPGCRQRARSRAGSQCSWCWQRKTCCCSTAYQGGRTPGRALPAPTPCWPHGSCTRHCRTSHCSSCATLKVFLSNSGHLFYFVFIKYNMIHCTITGFYSKCWRLVATRTVLWFWCRHGLPLTLKWGTLEPMEVHDYENEPHFKKFLENNKVLSCLCAAMHFNKPKNHTTRNNSWYCYCTFSSVDWTGKNSSFCCSDVAATSQRSPCQRVCFQEQTHYKQHSERQSWSGTNTPH